MVRTRKAIKIADKGNSNVEYALRQIMLVMATRGINFWCLTNINDGMVLYIFESKKMILNLVEEATKFQSFILADIIAMTNAINHEGIEVEIMSDITEMYQVKNIINL